MKVLTSRVSLSAVHDQARIAAHHAALVRDPHRRDPFAQLVDALREPSAPETVLTLDADRAHVVVALLQHLDQLADLLGRILQVRVERDHVLAARIGEARHHRRMLAEVGVEQNHAGLMRAALELPAQHRGRAVLAAVVDEHALVGEPELVERGIEPLEQGVEHLLLVVDGDDDAEFGRDWPWQIAQ